jgi:MFS family permease
MSNSKIIFTTFFRQSAQLLTIGLFLIGPFIVRYDQLPWGYETPKGTFVMLMSIIISIFGLLTIIPTLSPSQLQRKQILAPMLVIVGWLMLTTWQASDPQMALWGNQFRQQGLIFNLGVIAMWSILPLILDRSSNRLLLIVLIGGGIFQALMGIYQAINLFFNYSLTELTAGFYVNGTFGQSEFYSGKILLTLALILFALQRLRTSGLKQRKVLQLVLMLGLVASLLALFLSFSLAAWGIAVIGLLIFVYPYAKERWGRLPVKRLYLVGGILAAGLFMGWLRYDYRGVIWNEAIKFITANAPVFGIGLDNQQFAFAAIPDVIIDRGHNAIIDIIITIGWGGLCLVLIFLLERIQKIYRQVMTEVNIEKRIILVGLLMLVLRLMVHTTSAINIAELVLVAIWWQHANLWKSEIV